MLVANGLADALRVALGFPLPISPELLGWAQAVVDEIQNFAQAGGSVDGEAPTNGGPLIDGAQSAGTISGMQGPRLATAIAANAGYPFVTPCLEAYAQAIVDHIQNDGNTEFPAGDITGNCTNTISSPGSLTGGQGQNGLVINLDGPTLAQEIANACFGGSVSPELLAKSTAMVDYIMNNAVVEYPSGQVTGDCPAGGGPLQNGDAAGGTIS